jgi:hypothetical protein
METRAHPPGLQDVLQFPLVEALYGRRARRFSFGASIPDGPLAFTSRHDPLPLTELEQMLVLTAAAGNTGWHYMIMRHARYAPTSLTTPPPPGVVPSPLPQVSTPAKSSSPTMRASTSSRPATPPRWSSRRPMDLLTSMPSWKPTEAAYASSLTVGSTSQPKSPTWRGTIPGAPTARGARCSSL